MKEYGVTASKTAARQCFVCRNTSVDSMNQLILICSKFPMSEPLFKKVQREHSHSDDSDDLVGALVASDLAVRETDVDAATLVVAAAGGLYDCAAAW